MPLRNHQSGNHERVLCFREARQLVEDYAKLVQPTSTEKVSLNRAVARFLAEPICADRDLPPFARATRDGFAVHAADLVNPPVRLSVIGEIKAGAVPESLPHKVAPGETVAIMTGAPLPADTDAVLAIEDTSSGGDQMVEALRTLAVGENVVAKAADALAGEVLLPAGVRLTPARIAAAAAVGSSTVTVYRRPQVAILTTGDEIVPIHTFPGPTQIRNSNLYSLAAQIELAGGEPVPLPISPDEPRRLRELMAEALTRDLALFVGGASVGRYDLVEEVVKEFKAEFDFTGVRIQPGKPLVFGRATHMIAGHRRAAASAGSTAVRRVPFFGMPGNPVSAMVTFELFVRPVVRALAGGEAISLLFPSARLACEFTTHPGLTRFIPARSSMTKAGASVEPLPWHGSGDVVTSARANCLLVVPDDRERIAAGEDVSIFIPGAELQ